MLSIENCTEAAEVIPFLVADIFHLAGEFRRLGDRIASRVGQTQARWQVLSVVSDGNWTVAQIARRLGYARQSVQRTADHLVGAGLTKYKPNPKHAKAPLLEISGQGKTALARITREAGKWHQKLGAEVELSEISTALRVVRRLCSVLDGKSARTSPDIS
jgi:DNA-binding MarR family transcriptional regulator